MMIRSLLIPAAIAAACFSCTVAPQDDVKTTSAPISGGNDDGDNGVSHPAVIGLRGPLNCSATVIAVRNGYGYALTAAHCFGQDPDKSRYTIVQGNDLQAPDYVYSVDDIFFAYTDTWNGFTWHYVDTYEPSVAAEVRSRDFAVVRFLGGAGMATLPILSNDAMLTAPVNGAPGTSIEIVGYGASSYDPVSDNQTDAGIKRWGTNSISHLGPGWLWYDGGPQSQGACEGDSGGPVIVKVPDANGNLTSYVAGVASTASGVCNGQAQAGRVATDYDAITAYVNSPLPAGNTCSGPRPTTRCKLAGGWHCCGAEQGWTCGVCD